MWLLRIVPAAYVVQQRFGGGAYSRLEIIPVAIIEGDAVPGVDGRSGRAAVILLLLAGRIRADKHQPVVITIGERQLGQVVAVWFGR